MAESQKGTSAAADSKKSSSFGSDGDFGKDFLSSWKSSKKGKDQIDFVVDSAPRNMKKAFNFDKLDDFELGGDFDKLSSFKMDMLDLDFSSPLKKTEKPKGKSCEVIAQGKKEAKHDKFSFNFVFNELDNFEIDTNLLKGEGRKHDKDKELIMHDENQESDIHEKSRHSRGNSVIKTDVSEDNEAKRVPISEGMSISSSEHLVEPNTANFAGPSTSDYGHQDVSHEAVISTDKELIVVEENKNAKYSRPSFSLLSVSGDSSAQQALPKFEKRLVCLDTAEANPARELDDTARSVDSSQSRNLGPVNSNNSRCWRRTSSAESPNSTGDSQKLQGNQIETTSGTIDPSETTKCHKVDNACAGNFSQKIDCQSKFTSDKQNSGPKLLPSPLHRGSLLGKFMSLNAKTTAVLQLKPLTKSAENELQPTSAQIQKQLCAVDSGKLQTTNVYPSNENRESKQNVEITIENQHGSILKPQIKSLAEGISIVTGSVKSDNFDTSHPQLPPSDLPGQTTANSTVKNMLPNLLSGTATKKTLQKTSIEKQAISLKDGKICDKASFKLPGITKSNINTSNFTTQKETKLVRFLERKLDLPLNAASRTSSSAITKTYTLSSSSLKRKIVEESRADPEMLNPSKRVMESPTDRRKSLEASPAIDKKVVLGTRNQGNASMDNLASPKCFPEMRSVADFEVPVLIENDGNVEKAEACAKELEDICNMLKKKQEEAKELLVRVMVNNNALLMLNHPMHDEKIRTLQRFASSLQSREF